MTEDERAIILAVLDFWLIVGGAIGLAAVGIIAMSFPLRCRMPDPPEPWQPSTPYLLDMFNASKGKS